jgi:ABC-type nitrate/sulfonate/bicarbonate transport system substrate-binding protein
VTIRACLPTIALSFLALAPGCKTRSPGAAGASGAPEVLAIRHLASPGLVMPVELAEDLGFLAPLHLVYVGDSFSGPQSIQSVLTGDTDIGGAFNSAVIKLASGQAPLVAVLGLYGTDENVQSELFVPEASPLRTARDLLGRRVAMNTLGAHSELITREFLFRAGIGAAEARQLALVPLPPTSTEQALRSGQVDAAVIGQTYRDRALERGGLRSLFSDYGLYGPFAAGTYVMRRRFVADNPNATRLLVAGTARAIAWSQRTPRAEVLARFRSIMARRHRNETDALVPYWKGYGLARPGGLIADGDFTIWLDWLVRNGELEAGQVKARDLYTNAFNPYADPAFDGGKLAASAAGRATEQRP